MNIEKFLRRKIEGTLPQKVFRRFKDFIALNYPNLYEKIWRIRKGVKYTDCGKNILIEMRNSPAFLRQKKIFDFSLSLPLNFQTDFAEKKVAAVIHIFYPELAEEIKNLLYNVPSKTDVYISTVDDEKKSTLEKIFADFKRGKVTIKIFPNRGRDIAPAFIGFKDIYKNYDLCLHLHTKKSPHATNRLFGWREYLYHNLLGSKEIVSGIFQIMDKTNVGIVFPQYFSQIRISINWGENFSQTQKFLARFGIDVDMHNLLEFPAGSMFWFKPKALTTLFESGLTFEDFPEEFGQTDGTLAHALERSFLYIAENLGYSWVKVNTLQDEPGNPTILKSLTKEELEKNIKKVWKPVLVKNNFRR